MNDSGTRKALGRGLAALIPPAPPASGGPGPAAPTNSAASGPGLRTLPIERLKPNPTQPRKVFDPDKLDELAASIREQGLLQPIIVRRQGDAYEIVAGERRWRAATRAGYQEVPVVVRELTDEAALQIALVENIQRADLDPLEEAEAYSRLIREHGMTQEEVGQAVGKSRVAITNSLRLLKLPPPIVEMLADGRLTAGHARALMTLPTEPDMVRLAEDVVRRRASVRDTEAKARMMNRSAKKAESGKPRSPNDVGLEERLQRTLQTKVRLHHRAGKGRVEIFFHSLEELDRILEIIEA